MTRHVLKLLILPVIAALAGCGGSGNGSLGLSITDAPVDGATSVVVEITAVEAVPVTGNPIVYNFPQPQQIDLLQVQQGLSTPLITDWSLPAGQYRGLLLTISADGSGTDSYIVLDDGSQHALIPYIPPNTLTCGLPCSMLTSLNINTPFVISAGSNSSEVIEFDARKSVLPPAPGSTAYELQPEGRMVGATASGNIIGTVSPPLITRGCTPAVYVFAGANANPVDLNNSAPPATQPVTESAVTLNNTTGNYDFTAAFLPAGTYTLAFTCEAAQDNPAVANTISFTSVGAAPAVAGQTILVNLH